MPQNSWAPIATSSSSSAPVRPIASIQIWRRGHDRRRLARVIRLLDRERDADKQHPARDERDQDRHDDAARAAARGVVGLLGHVRRGVVPGEGVLGHQQPDRQDVPPADVEPGEVLQVGEHELGRGVVRARLQAEHQRADDDQHAGDVPPDADVVQQRYQPDAELVQQAVYQQHARRRSRPCASAWTR